MMTMMTMMTTYHGYPEEAVVPRHQFFYFAHSRRMARGLATKPSRLMRRRTNDRGAAYRATSPQTSTFPDEQRPNNRTPNLINITGTVPY